MFIILKAISITSLALVFVHRFLIIHRHHHRIVLTHSIFEMNWWTFMPKLSFFIFFSSSYLKFTFSYKYYEQSTQLDTLLKEKYSFCLVKVVSKQRTLQMAIYFFFLCLYFFTTAIELDFFLFLQTDTIYSWSGK